MGSGYCFGCMERIETYPCPRCGYSPRYSPLPYALQPGTILSGRYLVGRVLGQGGFGITYIGLDLQLHRKVAIKEYYPAGFAGRKTGTSHLIWYTGEDAQAARRSGTEVVMKEARKMSRVSGIDAVVKVFTVFQENETAYICMDYIQGITLQKYLKQSGPLPWERAKDIFLPVIQAMEQVHQEGLIHRDLSPDNLMLQPNGGVKILDLGAAKDLHLNSGKSSMQVAKNGFSPLEQYIQTGNSGSWTDVYAMAATIYFSLTGTLPPSAIDRMDKDALRWDLPQLQQLPPEVCSALKHALEIRFSQRTQTMAEFLQELQGKRRKLKKPKKWWIPLTAAVAVAAAAAIVIGICFGRDRPKDSGFHEPPVSVADRKPQIDELMERCTMETYDYRNGARMELYFDDQDHQRLRIYTNEDGKDEFIILAEYDEQGRFLEQWGFEGQQLVRHTLWTRNTDGNATQILTYQDGSLTEKTDVTYDDRGRESSRTVTDGAGTITLQASSTYDSQGRETYSGTHEDGSRFVNTYSADGQLLESTNTTKDGRPESRTVYQYDSSGNRTEYSHYDETGQLSFRCEYHYRGSLETGYDFIFLYDGEEDVSTYTYLLGPRNISFGQQYESDGYSSTTEYVQDIAESCYIRNFSYNEGQYITADYEITYFDWGWDRLYSEGFDGSGNLVSKAETLFDESGSSIGSVDYSWEPDGSYTVYRYDADYSVQSHEEYHSDGTLLEKTEYLYAADGTELGSIRSEYSGDGSYTQTEMDASYHTTAVRTYDSADTLLSMVEYSYDSSGKQIRSVLTTYYYDGSYTVTEKDANYRIVSEITYDAQGNPISS